MKTILVTGGAGFIGSHMVKLLLHEGYKVIVIDNLTKGHREAVPEGANFINGDLCDSELLEKAFLKNSIDAVIHFAAFIEVGESICDPEKYYRNNVFATLNLLHAMIEANVKNFIFSSSAAIYGEPNYIPIDEQHSKNPLSPYGQSKLMVEKMFHDFESAHGLNHISLRYFNAAGAHLDGKTGEQHHPETHLIPLLFEVVSGKREYISIFGDDYPTEDGTCVRDYVHVVDLCQAHLLALKGLLHGTTGSGAYNLGSGEGYSVKEIINEVQNVTGKNILFTTAARRTGDPAFLVADPRKAIEDLGWKPAYSDLKTIISSAWNFYLHKLNDRESLSHTYSKFSSKYSEKT